VVDDPAGGPAGHAGDGAADRAGGSVVGTSVTRTPPSSLPTRL
jgi:hypothetical protein